MNRPHRPDVKGATPLETWHITAECRGDDLEMVAWMRAVNDLRAVYFAQLAAHPGDTFSVAIYRTAHPEEGK